MKRNGTTSKGTTRWRCKTMRCLQADHETGRPALYDNAIDTNYTHSIGIQKAKSNPHDTPGQTHFLTLNPHKKPHYKRKGPLEALS